MEANGSTGTAKSIKEYREKTSNNRCFIGIRTVTFPGECFYFHVFLVLFPGLLLPLLLVSQTNCTHMNPIKVVPYLRLRSSGSRCWNVCVQPFSRCLPHEFLDCVFLRSLLFLLPANLCGFCLFSDLA